jgi:hypothetical protein
MRAFVLQDWVTIRGAAGLASVIQNEASYAQLDAFQDVIFWLQASEVTVGGGTVTMNYETAPIKDESLFTAMSGGSFSVTTGTLTPKVTPVLLNSAIPVAKWVRWHLTTSSTSTVWDITFRLLLVANQQVVYSVQTR